MAQYEHCSFRVAFNYFGQASNRAQAHRQQHDRAFWVERTVRRSGNHQHVLMAFKFEGAIFDGQTQARLIIIKPGLGNFRVRHRDCSHGRGGLHLVLFSPERPPPMAIGIGPGDNRRGLGIRFNYRNFGFWRYGYGRFGCGSFIRARLGNLVGPKGPPMAALCGIILGSLSAAGNSQAQSKGDTFVR